MNEDIIIVFVFYNPSKEQIDNADLIAKHHHVVVVDNSTQILNGKYSFQYISLGGNRGIAYAQNEGVRYAKENGYKYIFFFDQDSKIDEFYIMNLLSEYKRLKEIDPDIASIGPTLIDNATQKAYKGFVKGKINQEVDAIISSGSIVETITFDKVGGLDNSLFIDYVDFEWCWRAISKGYSIYITPNVTLNHSIGSKYHMICGLVINISAPVRYYYQYRNTLLLTRRKYVPLKWKFKSILRKAIDIFIVPFFVTQKKETLTYMLKGTFAGLINKQ